MRGLLRSVFLEDATLKLISLILALSLFFFRSDREYATSAYVRIQYTYPQDRIVTSQLPGEVKVQIRGPWSRASRFSESDLEPMTIDLSRQEEGDLRFTEDMVHLPRGLRVGSFTPPSVYVNFEPKIERTLPVQAIIEGEPGEGYRLGRVTATPRTVRITGARSAVEAMHNVPTRPVRVAGLKSSVEMSIRLTAPPRFVWLAESPEITVQVEVLRTLVERTYTNVQITITGSARTGDIQLQPDKATVVLRGPALALEGLKGTPEVVVDAATEERKPPGTYRKRLQVVNLPPDVAAEIRPESVHMTLKAPHKP